MDWSQRRAVMQELKRIPVRERGRMIRDYAAGRPISPEKLALLHRWAPAYPPYGWIQIGIGLAAAALWVAPAVRGARLSALTVAVLLFLLAGIYQAVRNLRCSARLRREAGLVPEEPVT